MCFIKIPKQVMWVAKDLPRNIAWGIISWCNRVASVCWPGRQIPVSSSPSTYSTRNTAWYMSWCSSVTQSAGKEDRFRSAHLSPPIAQEILREVLWAGAAGWTQSAGQEDRFRWAHLPPSIFQEILSEILWAGAGVWLSLLVRKTDFGELISIHL